MHISILQVGFATRRLRQHLTANVARHLIHGTAKDKLLIVAFAASNTYEAAFRLRNKLVPFTHDCHLSLTNHQFSQPDAHAVPHVTANLALQAQSLLLRRLRKLTLQRVLLPTITPLLPSVSTLTLRHGTAFSSLVQRNRVILVLLAMRTVSPNFFGSIHGNRIQLSINETHAFLYLFRQSAATQTQPLSSAVSHTLFRKRQLLYTVRFGNCDHRHQSLR